MDLKVFIQGFEKRADLLGGGKGFTGSGKGNLSLGKYENPTSVEGPRGAFSGQDDVSPRNSKEVYDRVGNPRSHSIFDNGPIIVDDSNPHILY